MWQVIQNIICLELGIQLFVLRQKLIIALSFY